MWLIPPTQRPATDQLHNATTEMLHTMYTLGLFADVKVRGQAGAGVLELELDC